MNYGRYFRLNQSLSKVVDGVAIYDYIDLPVYFGPSVDNPMSPKYPISVTITSDAVCFRLHYSAFKLEKSGNSKYPQYAYDRDDIDRKALDKQVNVGMAHMEEAILELPFADISSIRLSDTIKEIYNTKFPLQEKEGKEQISYGGRFIEQLIRKRYPGYIRPEEEVKELSLEDKLYHKLQIVSDNAASYSSLWLMDLKNNSGDAIYLYDRNKKNTVIGFLRKLLLDFMFDLKHSDVFQNSADYQKMYSGLMSDFYFSALMHKCEYYYYRKLTSKAIEENKEIGNANLSINEKEIICKERKKAITVLYANELVKAEDLWIKDIINPQAEKDFEHRYPGKHKKLRDWIEYYNFKQWPSWFAEPEEEMRRVCFTMKDVSGVKHICNADTLIRYLNIDINSQERVTKKIINLRDADREKISRWFLKQYAFNDVLHLHLFKHANLLFLLLFTLSILLLWAFHTTALHIFMGITVVVLVVSMTLSWIYKHNVCNSCRCHTTCSLYYNMFYKSTGDIVNTRRTIIKEKIKKSFLVSFIALLFLYIGLSPIVNKVIEKTPEAHIITNIVLFLFLALSIFVLANYRWLVSCLHLFLPRLVASITLAWITLSMGVDLYVSFFDSAPSIPYIVTICIIVLFFVMYSINLVIPHSPPLRKLLRSIELMIVSYLISLSVGFVIVNFLGEKYLERGGYISDYYEQYIENKNDSAIEFIGEEQTDNDIISKIILSDSSIVGYEKMILAKIDSTNAANNIKDGHIKQTEGLQKVTRNGDRIAYKRRFWGMPIFVLPKFLFMFAFIAMFTGIFIQLIIFGDNKQMTEL